MTKTSNGKASEQYARSGAPALWLNQGNVMWLAWTIRMGVVGKIKLEQEDAADDDLILLC